MEQKKVKYRFAIVVTASIITLLSVLLFPKLNINPNLDDYVPDHLENQVNLVKLDSIFGGSEMILVMLHSIDVTTNTSLNRLRLITNDLAELNGIDRCISPFDAKEINYEGGFMSMDPILEDLPKNMAESDLLKKTIAENTMAKNFFSDDFSLVSIVLTKNTNTSDRIIEDITAITEKHKGEEEVLLGGLPFIRYSITGNIKSDLIILLPIALILMVFMLHFSFHEWKGVFMPFLIVVMSIILSFGVMALLGWQISLITILMPIMLIAIANDYGIHMIARYQELLKSGQQYTMAQICKQIYLDLKLPIIITGLTTIGGVLGLLTHTMIPAAQLGVLTAIGIGFALLLSILFLPAALSYFKLPKNPVLTEKDRIAPVDKWLFRFSKWAAYHPKRIVTISVIIGIVGTLGILLLKVDTNIEGYFLGKSEVRKSTHLINEKFGGTQFISVVFNGDVLNPELLNRLEDYQREIEKESIVGFVQSPVTLVKELSKGFYLPNEKGYNQIPESADEVYQFIEVFSMGGNEDAVEQFIDYNYENARMIVSLKDGSNNAGKYLFKRLKEIMQDDSNVSIIAGPSLTKIELADMVVRGQIKSLIFAMLVIFIIISIVFRSAGAGLISSLPLSIAILTLFGLMGFLGISMDIATALLSSIMIGVGVDYTIHFLWRFKTERSKGVDYQEAVRVTLSTAGRGIIFNAISVIVGFLALSFSNFAPLRFFSALIVISISICLISALLLVPGVVVLLKPKFLDK